MSVNTQYPSVSYSCIQDNDPNDGSIPYPAQGGNTNIDDDPMFFNGAAGNFRLRLGSPCVDAGRPTGPDVADVDDDHNSNETTPDLDLRMRTLDDPTKTDTGLPPPPVVDMGAYEFCIGLGDMNADAHVNGDDIQPWVNCLSLHPQGSPILTACDRADMDQNNILNLNDLTCFVTVLLEGPACALCGYPPGQFRAPDCNANSIPDAIDIADGTSQDCNQNFIPDECDLDETDPDGDESVSADVNGNSIPDECEPDCNGNHVPDAWDISQQTSADVNANAVPDECEADCNQNDLPDSYELAQQSVPDCNANGIPDGCEADCTANGVPDDCDIDPNDPDGNNQVSPDCNANGVPDSCDLSLPPPFGSVDCNSNNIPDECDIGSGHCWDENNNGVCDNCEAGSMEGRSGGDASDRAPTGEPYRANAAPNEEAAGGEGSAIEGEGNTGEDAGATNADANTAGGGGSQDTRNWRLETREENANTNTAGEGDQGGSTNGCATFARGGTPAEEAAWEAYYDWSMAQVWGPASALTGEEQFLLIQEKAIELGLDVAEIVGR